MFFHIFTDKQREVAFRVVEGVRKDRHICTPDDWRCIYEPAIVTQVTLVVTLLSKGYGRPVNSYTDIPVKFLEQTLTQEDLHIPESKRRRFGVGVSARLESTLDTGTLPQIK